MRQYPLVLLSFGERLGSPHLFNSLMRRAHGQLVP